jgi:molecular chaperone DnaK (HSP70)
VVFSKVGRLVVLAQSICIAYLYLGAGVQYLSYQAEDDKQKDRISAKNGLESYCFNMKTTIEDEKVKDKISEEDRKKITDKCDEAIKWLDANQLAEVESVGECQ